MKHEARNMRHETRILVMAGLVAIAAVGASAMPTKAEFKKAEPLVAELMAPVMTAFKEAGSKDKAAAAVKVADASAEFAKVAETEAAKFLLLKGAVSFYTRGEAYDKAADVLAVLLSEVKDVPPTVVAEIAGKATGRISETKAPRLFALYRKAKLQVRAAGEAKSLAQKLKKVKSDALQRRYAEALAVSGDWKKAYGEFAKLNDAKLKAVVEAEANGMPKNAESGEFWWTYETAMEDAEDIFKAHAAAFYRQALAAGEITGLKKNIVEQRIKPYGEAVAAVTAPVTVTEVTPEAGAQIEPDAIERKELRINGSLKKVEDDYLLELSQQQTLKFLHVPAGKFRMGFSSGDYKRLPICEITRQFWMTEGMITIEQWEKGFGRNTALKGIHKGHWDEDVKSGGWWQRVYGLKEVSEWKKLPVSRFPLNEIKGVCKQLTEQYKDMLPRGCVFRLPTNAEWQYVYKNVSNRECDILYANECDLELYLKATMVPHKWGFKNVSGAPDYTLGGGLVVLDCLGSENLCDAGDKCKKINFKSKLPPDLKKDPLWYCLGNDVWCFVANQWNLQERKLKRGHQTFTQLNGWRAPGIRLVIGPDLVSEWKAKNGKK